MEAVFLKILNMSITASWLVVAVVLLRLVFKKAPKIVSLILWALVGIRLVLPFSLESVFSLVPSAQTFPSDITTSPAPIIQSGIPVLNTSINPIISQSLAPNVSDSVNPMQIISVVASIVWAAGVAAMLLYALISYVRLRLKVREAVKLEGKVMLCDSIASPFILGIIKPKIYIPSSVDEQDLYYVLAHENAHLGRRDHFWKPLGFLLLSVYWFNPIMWVAYILLCRDIELACDEKVIKSLGVQAKKQYSTALVNCSVSRKAISVCPLAFGEVGVKKRVKTVLNYKKPAFWIIIIALITCIVVAVCFLTNPPSDDTDTTNPPDTTTTTTNPDDVELVGSPYWSGAHDTPYLDSINCDIDGDGLTEEVRLYAGPTSGVNSYVIAVWDYKTLETVEMFSMMTGSWEFNKFADGALYITQTEYNAGNMVSTLKLTFNSGDLVFSGDESGKIYQGGMTYRNSSYTFDIDGDGKKEFCLITPVEEYPYTLFRFIVWQDAAEIAPKYYNVFNYDSMYSFSFAERPDGTVVLHGKKGGVEAVTVTLDISIDKNRIVLAQGKDKLNAYHYPGDPYNFNYGYYFDPRNSTTADLDGDGQDETFTIGYEPFPLAYSSVPPGSNHRALMVTDGEENYFIALGRQEFLSLKKDDYGGVYIHRMVIEDVDGITVAGLKLLCEVVYENGEYSVKMAENQ